MAQTSLQFFGNDIFLLWWRVCPFHFPLPKCSSYYFYASAAAAAAKLLQSCPTLCNPMDCRLPGSPVPGILQARTLEWVAISFSNAWKWKVKVKSLSRVRLLATPWTAAQQAPPSMGFSGQQYWSGVPLPSPSGLLLTPSSVFYFFLRKSLSGHILLLMFIVAFTSVMPQLSSKSSILLFMIERASALPISETSLVIECWINEWITEYVIF